MARVLGVVRLSREREESTSVARQRQYIETWCDQNGHVLVGVAEDIEVSGGTAPWDRPQLGGWLPETIGGTARTAEWDVLCAWRLDRISRRVLHLSALIDWCKRHGKSLASTSEGFDINSPMGGIFVNILAALAEGELEAIRERARSSFTHLMKEGRWRGGFVPYGYRAVKGATGEGWRLEIDRETSTIFREVAEKVIAGSSANAMVRWLNDERVPSPLDVQRIRAGKPPTGAEWRVANLLRMLRSHTSLGYAEMTESRKLPDGTTDQVTRLVRGEDGLPLRRADPILTQAEWDSLQKALGQNSNKRAGNRYGGSPLLRVAFCECGEPLYRNQGRSKQYYRCGRRARAGQSCSVDQSAIPADVIERVVEEAFLSLVGDLEVMERTFVPGTDHAAEVAHITEALAELRADRRAGLYRGDRGDDEYRAEYAALEAKREALEREPSRADEWVLTPSGETYRERWESLTTPAERANELRRAGIRAILHREPVSTPALVPGLPSAEGGRVAIELPADLRERLEKLTTT